MLIQDADLEYDPEDWPKLLAPVLRRAGADVVYGSRFTRRAQRDMLFWHWVGNRFLSLVTNVLYNTTLSDMEIGYKPSAATSCARSDLGAPNDFDIEPEITAKILRRGVRIYEVPISYYGPRVRRGQEDHVARRHRRRRRARAVPLRAAVVTSARGRGSVGCDPDAERM